MEYERTFKYIGIAAVVLLLFGLGGWYLFISKETTSVEDAAAARGFSVGIPSFVGSRGSTAANTSAEPFGDGGETVTADEVGQPAPRLWRVSSAPVAGFSFTGSSTVRYVERASGNVFDADAATSKVERVTNTLIPRVYEALVNGDIIVERLLDDRGFPMTRTGTVGTTTEQGAAELLGGNLGDVIRAIALTPSSADILMLATTGNGAELIRAGWNGSSPKPLLSLPAGDFRILWPSEDRILLVEKAGSGVPGSAYRARTSLEPLVLNIPGLTVLAHTSSDALLYASDDGLDVQLFVRPSLEASAASIPLKTVADKCAWAPGSSLTAYCAVPESIETPFLDRWYRGETHTVDTWYSVNASAATADKLIALGNENAIDVESPAVDPSGTYLGFINARDKALWVLRITE